MRAGTGVAPHRKDTCLTRKIFISEWELGDASCSTGLGRLMSVVQLRLVYTGVVVAVSCRFCVGHLAGKWVAGVTRLVL